MDVHVCAGAYICVHIHVCTHGEEDLGITLMLYLALATLFLTQGLPLVQSSLSSLGWIASKPQGAHSLCLPTTRIINVLTTTLGFLLNVYSVAQTQLPMLVHLIGGLPLHPACFR